MEYHLPRGVKYLVFAFAFVMTAEFQVNAQYFRDDFDGAPVFTNTGIEVQWLPLPPFETGERYLQSGSYILETGIAANQGPYTESDSYVPGVSIANSSLTARIGIEGTSRDYLFGIFGRNRNDGRGNAASSVFALMNPAGGISIGAFDTAVSGGNSSWNATTSLKPHESPVDMQLDLFGHTAALTVWAAGTEKPTRPQIEVNNLPVYISGEGEVGLWAARNLNDESMSAVFDFFEVSGIAVGGIDRIGAFNLSGQDTLDTVPSNGPQSGLLQRWYSVRNPGSLDDIYSRVFDPFVPDAGLAPDVAPFHSSATWWSGSFGVDGLPPYPVEIGSQVRSQDGGLWNYGNNDNYTVYMTGELLIPESGTYRFLDGVDDFAAFGIDLNGDGHVEDGDGEFLINDNSWTNITRESNNGGLPQDTIPSVTFTDVPEGGQWYTIEAIVAEGGRGDAGVIYWDYDTQDRDQDGIRIGDAEGFPTAARGGGRAVAEDDIPQLLIPESFLRSEGGVKLTGGHTLAVLESAAYDFELGEDGQADQLVVTRHHELLRTELDATNATFRIDLLNGIDPNSLTPGEYQLLVADGITGMGELDIADELLPFVDVSRLFTDGVLVVGSLFDCNSDGVISVLDANCSRTEQLDVLLQQVGLLRGDADGNGEVEFLDFLRLSNGFGKAGQYTDGDFNKNGQVEFADFLIQSNNYGKVPADVASVPEPRSVLTIGLAVCLVALRRRW